MGSAAPSRASRAEPSLAALRQLLAALGLLLLGAGGTFHEEGFASWAFEVQRGEGLEAMYKYLHPGGWYQTLSLGLSDRKRNSDCKLKHKKFHFNIRKNFFALKVAEHWKRLPGGSWSFSLSRHSNSTWTRSCVSCSK